METQTITANNAGWSRFLSFIPENMVYMDGKFYSFNKGNLYMHNAGDVNTFYGVKSNSSMRTVINDAPDKRKLFEAIALNGNSAWSLQMQTDVQNGGFIDATMFERKEGVYYAHVRVTESVPDVSLSDVDVRQSVGVGDTTDIAGDTNYHELIFDASKYKVPEQLSVGDYMYAIDEEGTKWIGSYDGISQNVVEGELRLMVAKNGSTATLQSVICYVFAVKNRAAESSGILGQTMIIDMELNPTAENEELFSIDAALMQSYP